jgi:hypothetical protein
MTIEQINRAAEELLSGQHVFLHAGHVPNSYGYDAYATAAVVWRDSDGVAWTYIITTSAKKGSTGFGRRSAWVPPTGELSPNLYARVDSLLERASALGMSSDTPIDVLADAAEECGNDQLAAGLRAL